MHCGKYIIVSPLGIPWLMTHGGHSNITMYTWRDQYFSKTPLNKFLLPDENHPLNEFTYKEKVTLNKFLLKKYPLQVFVTKFTHPKVNYWGEHLRMNREEESTLFA